MDEVGQNDGDRDDGMRKSCFLNEASLVDDRRCCFRKREREKIPDQKSNEKKEIIIFDRLFEKEGKDKSNDEHLQKRIGD